MSINEVNAHFSSRAAQYDSGDWVQDQKLIEAVLEELPPRASGTWVDAGAGTGVLASAVSALGSAYRVLCVDMCHAMLASARRRNLSCVQADIHQLPFPSQSVDGVLIRQVLHYSPSPQRALSEASRVIRPGGKIIIGQFVPFDYDDQVWMNKILSLRQPLRRNFMSVPELSHSLAAAGCKKIRHVDFIRHASLDNWLDRYPLDKPKHSERIRRLFGERMGADSPRNILPSGRDVRFLNRFVVMSGILEP
jgi:SAM-dependent methyltransferase